MMFSVLIKWFQSLYVYFYIGRITNRRSLFDTVSTNAENMGPSASWWKSKKKLTTAGQANRSQAVAVRSLPALSRTAYTIWMIQDVMIGSQEIVSVVKALVNYKNILNTAT